MVETARGVQPGRALRVFIAMAYRDDLEAARMRRDVLACELDQVRSRMSEFEELARQAEALERELAQSARDLDQVRLRVELPLLQQVRVASPCKERWDDMQGDERVRFCGRCEKNVYDLSALTASQAEALLREREGESMCVRFFRRSDGTILTADCPVGQRKRFWRRAAATAVAGGLAAAGIAAAALAGDAQVMGQMQPMMGEPAIHEVGEMQPEPVFVEVGGLGVAEPMGNYAEPPSTVPDEPGSAPTTNEPPGR